MKWLTVAGVALLVVVAARAMSAPRWDYVQGYKPGSGYYA